MKTINYFFVFIFFISNSIFAQTPLESQADESTETNGAAESTELAPTKDIVESNEIPEVNEVPLASEVIKVDSEIKEKQEAIKSQITYSNDSEISNMTDEETPLDPDMFVTTAIGTALHKYSIEGGIQFGMYNHVLNWFSSFSIILWQGEVEINFPFTYYNSDLEIEKPFTNPDHSLFSTGIKYRKWELNEDVGLFYGAGLRVSLWNIKYDIKYNSKPNETIKTDPFIVFTPQLEMGYQWALNRDFACRTSAELGYSLSSYTSYTQGENFTEIDYQNNSIHWNILLGLVYGF